MRKKKVEGDLIEKNGDLIFPGTLPEPPASVMKHFGAGTLARTAKSPNDVVEFY